MGAAVNVAIAAAASRAQRDLLDHFRLAGATDPDVSIALPDTHRLARRTLDRWLRTGVVREAPGGGYWLDEHAYRQARQLQGRGTVIAALVVVGILLVIGLAVAVFGGGGARYQ